MPNFSVIRNRITTVVQSGRPVKSMSTNSSSAVALAYTGYSYSSKIVAKKSKTSQSSSPKGSEPSPPRITSNVKQNLQFLRSWKDFQKKKSNMAKPSTSYRRKRVEKDMMPEDTETEPYHDPTCTDEEIEISSPVLLVDGYNVCGCWAKLKKHFMRGDLLMARQKLIDELETYTMLKDVKVVVVFDAMMSGLPTHKESFGSIDVVYTGSTTADTWIQLEVQSLMQDGCPLVRVATSDRLQQISALVEGACVWSSKTLIAEIRESRVEVDKVMRKASESTSMQGRLLKHNLPADVVAALKDLRDKLSKNPPSNSN